MEEVDIWQREEGRGHTKRLRSTPHYGNSDTHCKNATHRCRGPCSLSHLNETYRRVKLFWFYPWQMTRRNNIFNLFFFFLIWSKCVWGQGPLKALKLLTSGRSHCWSMCGGLEKIPYTSFILQVYVLTLQKKKHHIVMVGYQSYRSFRVYCSLTLVFQPTVMVCPAPWGGTQTQTHTQVDEDQERGSLREKQNACLTVPAFGLKMRHHLFLHLDQIGVF